MAEENPLIELENEPTEKVLAEGEKTEGEETEAVEAVEAGEETEEVKEKTRVEKRQRLNNRVRDLNTKFRESERDLKAEKAKNAVLMEQNRIKEEPNPDNYTDNDTFNKDRKAYSDQEIEDKVNSRIEARDKASMLREANEQINKQTDIYVNNRVKAIEADPKYREYEKSVDDAIKTFDAHEIETAVLKGDGIELVKYFGKNPDVLEDIALMSPSDRMYELGKIANEVKAKAPKTISSAPKPTRDVKLSATIPTVKTSGLAYNPKKETWSQFCIRKNNK